jgi:hypothetical protein
MTAQERQAEIGRIFGLCLETAKLVFRNHRASHETYEAMRAWIEVAMREVGLSVRVRYELVHATGIEQPTLRFTVVDAAPIHEIEIVAKVSL